MVPRIDVRNEIARKNFTGTLRFTFDAEEGLIDIPYVEFSSPVTAELSYELFLDGKAEVSGKVSFHLKGLCSRCLAETEEEVSYDAVGVFAPVPKDEEYGYSGGSIDLREFLRDSVMFALPSRLLCGACAEETESRE